MSDLSLHRESSLASAIAQALSITLPAATPALALGSLYGVTGTASWQVYLLATIVLVFAAWLTGLGSAAGSLADLTAAGLGRRSGLTVAWALLIAYVFVAAAALDGAVNSVLLVVSPAHAVGSGGALGLGLTIAIAGLAWAISGRGVRFSTRVLIGLVAIPLVLILAAGVLYATQAGNHLAETARVSIRTTRPDLVRQGLVLAFFSFTGFESAASLGNALPQRLVPRALVISVLLAGLFFTLSALLLVAVHQDGTVPLDADATPLDTLALAAGLPKLGWVLTAGLGLSFIGGIIGALEAGSRLIEALAGREVLPRRLIAPRTSVAVLAGLALVLALGLGLRGAYLLDAFGYFAGIAGFGFLTAYVLAAIATPFYLARQQQFRIWHGVLGIGVTGVLLVLFWGSLLPLPAPPYTFLPVIFLVLLIGGWVGSWAAARRRKAGSGAAVLSS